MPDLIIRLDGPPLAGLHLILGMGVGIQTTSGITLRELLCDQLGFDFEYIDRQVQTIFHNARAVDRINQVLIQSGDVIALSAAMPGLAGATLRKGGIFAALRKEISHSDNAARLNSPQTISVTLKMFNMVAKDLCGQLLRHGVWVKPDQLLNGLRYVKQEGFSIVYNGRPVTIEELPQFCLSEESIFLSVEKNIPS